MKKKKPKRRRRNYRVCPSRIHIQTYTHTHTPITWSIAFKFFSALRARKRPLTLTQCMHNNSGRFLLLYRNTFTKQIFQLYAQYLIFTMIHVAADRFSRKWNFLILYFLCWTCVLCSDRCAYNCILVNGKNRNSRKTIYFQWLIVLCFMRFQPIDGICDW